MDKIDLHIHTNYSDGMLNIPQLIEKLDQLDIRKVSITDHDTIIKIKKYIELFKQQGIELITGIEFNTSIPNLHILGYGITDLDKVEDTIIDIKKRNIKVCIEVIKLLQNAGIDITEEGIIEILAEESRKRMEAINQEIDTVSDYFIIDKRAIVKWLIKYGYVKTVLEAYDKYIGREAPHYIPIEKFDRYDVIKIILETGGVPVIAHPISVKKKNKHEYYDFIEDLKSKGLQGIEVYGSGPRMDDYWTEIFSDMAKNLNMLKTAGSDFHRESDSLGVHCDELIYEELIDTIKTNQAKVESGRTL